MSRVAWIADRHPLHGVDDTVDKPLLQIGGHQDAGLGYVEAGSLVETTS